MKVEHSSLMNEFISFWIETYVDGNPTYETMLDFMKSEWYTIKLNEEKSIVLEGELNSKLSEDEMIEEIKPIIELSIKSGKI